MSESREMPGAEGAVEILARVRRSQVMKPETKDPGKYIPDYKRACENCGAKPVVTAVKNGKVIYKGTMCGPCTWGEARTADPETWNEEIDP